MEPCWDVYQAVEELYMTYENQTGRLTLDIVVLCFWLLLTFDTVVYTIHLLQVKVKDPEKTQLQVQLDHNAKKKHRKQPKNKKGLKGPPRNGLSTTPVGFDLVEKLGSLDWVMLLTWDPSVTELFANTRKITLAKAKSQLQEQFGITVEQLNKDQIVIHMVERSEVQWLNGHRANFGSPRRMYFKDEKGKSTSCTTTCSIFDDYVITSGHGSVIETKYFKDKREKALIGTSIFHRCDKESDIAIIDTGGNAENRRLFGNSEAEILSGSARGLVEFCKGRGKIHKAEQTLTGKLKFIIDKEINVRGLAIQLREPGALEALVPGDSGALVTTEIPHNGTQVVKAIGLLGLRKKITTTNTEIPLAVAFPLGPSVEAFCQENDISA